MTKKRGTHRLLAQWVRVVEKRNGGFVVRMEDGKVSKDVIPKDEIVRIKKKDRKPVNE